MKINIFACLLLFTLTLTGCEDYVIVQEAVSKCEMIQDALENYKINAQDGLYPVNLVVWGDLAEIVNNNGGHLNEFISEDGFETWWYYTYDTNNDNQTGDSYCFCIDVSGVTEAMIGSRLSFTPTSAIKKMTIKYGDECNSVCEPE